VEEPGKGEARVGEITAAKTGFREEVGQSVRGRAKVGVAAAKAGLGRWIGASTATGDYPSGVPRLGPVDESASGGLRMGSAAAAKAGLLGKIGAPTAAGMGPVDEPAKGEARVGEIAAVKTGFRE